jgi:hypothetical protein
MHLCVAEGITMKSILLLNDGDLKELGFNMGQRRLLLKWIGNKSDVVVPESNVCSPGTPTPPTVTSQSPAGPSRLPSAGSSRSTPAFKVIICMGIKIGFAKCNVKKNVTQPILKFHLQPHIHQWVMNMLAYLKSISNYMKARANIFLIFDYSVTSAL